MYRFLTSVSDTAPLYSKYKALAVLDGCPNIDLLDYRVHWPYSPIAVIWGRKLNV